jgi:tRNA(His) guanylyltransferase
MGKNQEIKDELGERMKAYENVNRTYLTNGTPKVMRLDGCHFHTLLRGAEKPYDMSVMASMIKGATAVMKEIGGSARFAYIQSDEVTLGINDKLTILSEPWFGNNVQKMVSVAASIMAVNFTQSFNDPNTKAKLGIPTKTEDSVVQLKPAYFDARVFQVPNVAELHNAVLWRQFDASKNSISQYARSYFSHGKLQGKNGSEMQDMMMAEHQFNWNDAPTWTKRGVLLYRVDRANKDAIVQANENLTLIDGNIVADWEIPKFSEQPDFLPKLFSKTEDKE